MGTSDRRFCLVTGTSSGIGTAVARLLLERDWTVCGVARRPAPIEHDLYEHVVLDLGQIGELDSVLGPRLRARLSDAPSRVGLVNNAASADLLGPVEEIDPVRLQAVLAVNTVAPVVLTALISRFCPPHAALRVVNVSSGAAVSAFPGLAAYAASKAALRMAGMVTAAEWSSDLPRGRTHRNAAVISYEPGIVDTDMQTLARSHDPARFPWVGMFQAFADRGLLSPAEAPAREIVAFLETDGHPAFCERRLGRT
jgi:benzil reductase ((S)-benzoin forming)